MSATATTKTRHAHGQMVLTLPVEKVEECVSGDETRPSLTHLWVFERDGAWSFGASDAYVMAVVAADVQISGRFSSDAVALPIEAVRTARVSAMRRS